MSSGEVVPQYEVKEAWAHIEGEYPARVSDTVTAEQRALIAHYVDIRAFYGSHSDDPEAIGAAEEALASYDPQATIVGMESYGYVPSQELGPQQRDAPDDPDAFGRVGRRAAARGQRIFYADIDCYDSELWYAAHRQHAAGGKAPHTAEAVRLAIKSGAESFTDAASVYWHAKEHGTNFRPFLQGLGMPVPADGQIHRYRSRVAANRTVQVALEVATALHDGSLQLPGGRATLLLFYGAAHKDEIEEQFRNLGVRYEAIHTSGPSQYVPPSGELNAASLLHFGREYLEYWLGDQAEDAALMARLLSLSWQNHQDIYNILQARLAGHVQHLPVGKGVDAIRQYVTDCMHEDTLALISTFAPDSAAP